MVFVREHPTNMDDWAVPPFVETPKPPYMNIDVKERMVSLQEMIYKPQFLVAFPHLSRFTGLYGFPQVVDAWQTTNHQQIQVYHDI